MSNIRQREPRYENRALLDLCYSIPCQADWPHDCGPAEPSHSNQERHGKGKSRKAHDLFVAALCRAAHRELDQGAMFSREDKFAYWQRAHEMTLLEMFRRGLVQVNVCKGIDWLVATNVSGQKVNYGDLVHLVPKRRSRKTGHANGCSTESPSKIFRRPND